MAPQGNRLPITPNRISWKRVVYFRINYFCLVYRLPQIGLVGNDKSVRHDKSIVDNGLPITPNRISWKPWLRSA